MLKMKKKRRVYSSWVWYFRDTTPRFIPNPQLPSLSCSDNFDDWQHKPLGGESVPNGRTKNKGSLQEQVIDRIVGVKDRLAADRQLFRI